MRRGRVLMENKHFHSLHTNQWAVKEKEEKDNIDKAGPWQAHSSNYSAKTEVKVDHPTAYVVTEKGFLS